LATTLKSLTDPLEAATRVKKMLYGIFETYYQFDLEFLKKENLGKAVQSFDKMVGVTPFAISYISQHGLGGHSIPTDKALLNLMYVLGIISQDEAAKGKVPGLERAIAKAKGIEFSSLVHQLSVAFYKTPFSTTVRNKILKIDGSAKERFPKRSSKKKEESKPAKKAAPEKTPSKTASKTTAPTKKAAVKKATESQPKATKKAASKKKAASTKKTSKPAAKKKAAVKKKASANKAPVKKATKKKAKKKSR
jgi:endonuclease-3